MSDIFFGDFIEQIKEFQRQQLEEREKILADVITKYDFVVGSKDLKGMLETILPEGANIVYSQFIEDITSVYAIKKFDMMDYFSVGLDFEEENFDAPTVLDADTTRDCKTCGHSNGGKCAGTEECHECMWENKYIEAEKGEQE